MSDKNTSAAKQEWSHFIESENIGTRLIEVEISPPKEVIPALCKRLNLYGINNLKTLFEMQRDGINKIIHVKGRLSADVLQKCIISVEPVQESIDEEFNAWFADPNSAVSFVKAKRERMSKKEKNEQPIMEEQEDPEDIIDGKIDLGELVVQSLSLSLDPYPRADGAEHEAQETALDDAPEGTYDNPFAALKDWKAKEDKK